VLDVGCGGGILAEAMAQRGAEGDGNRPRRERPPRRADLHLAESKLPVTYEMVSAEDYAARHAGEFDVVTCMELLEHVPEPAGMVAACARLARPGGFVFFSTINRNPKSYLFAVIGAEYVLKLLRRARMTTCASSSPRSSHAGAGTSGLAPEELIGMTYNPFHAALQPRAQLRRQLPAALQARCRSRAALFDFDGTLADTAPGPSRRR
jgi:2-polyprenyl-6-hydroxyphenyl methylase/3-demethylubiquinone-9 3-methyltransferase